MSSKEELNSCLGIAFPDIGISYMCTTDKIALLITTNYKKTAKIRIN
jgi:hypothetical protein